MASDTAKPRASKAALWTGRVISAIPVLLLLMSAGMKLSKRPDVVDGFRMMGWPERLALALAIVELACTVIYVVPQTAVLGAILLTAYLGGATATHVRISDAFHMPVGLGVLVWLGLYLREPRLRALLPLRR